MFVNHAYIQKHYRMHRLHAPIDNQSLRLRSPENSYRLLN